MADKTKHGSAPRSPIILGILAVVVAGGIGGALVYSQTPEVSPNMVDARPTGAGSKPDGAVDELREGLLNETSTDTFIDQSASSDTVPPLLELEDRAPSPETSVMNLERLPESVESQISTN